LGTVIDLHTHTWPSSLDSELRPDELIEQAKMVGLDALCLTDHDSFWDTGEVARLSQEHHFLVLPGVEITTDEGHFLVYGLERYVYGMHRSDFLKRMVDREGGAMVLAHPYRRQFRREDYSEEDGYYAAVQRVCENPTFLLADAVEVLNGKGREMENGFSLEVCERLGLRAAGGSDAHALHEIGSCATVFDHEVRSLQDLISELKTGRFRAINLRKGVMFG
jgi:predicted metal-dependent phosphoesterase TrpH